MRVSGLVICCCQRYGTKILGSSRAAISATEDAPERETTKSAAASVAPYVGGAGLNLPTSSFFVGELHKKKSETTPRHKPDLLIG